MQDDRLERAIGLVNSGKIDDARSELELLIKEDRKNISAWRLYAETWPKASDKRRVWEACLRYNPENIEVQQALIELNPNQLPKSQKQEKAKSEIDYGNSPRNSRLLQWLVWGSLGLILIVAVIVVIPKGNSAPNNPEDYKHSQPVEYYLYVPKDYSPDQDWPLFVGIHGAGSSGLECWNLWQAYADKEGFILLCPTIPGDASGYYQDVGENTVWSAINAVKKDYHVKSKMFSSGFQPVPSSFKDSTIITLNLQMDLQYYLPESIWIRGCFPPMFQ